MRYPAYETLVAPARPSADLFRLLTGLGMTAVLFVCFSIAYSTLHQGLLPAADWEALAAEMETASTPASALLNLYLFGLMIAALWVTLRVVHQRGLFSLIGPLHLSVWQFKRSAGAVLLLYFALSFVPAPGVTDLSPNLPAAQWLRLLPLSLLGLLIQTSTEELLFRGYMQSQLAARFTNPVIWIGLPSLVFGLLHYDPGTNGANAWAVMVWATLFGLAAADLTARAGTLGPAIALHMVNNASAILIAAPKGYFDGLTLYTSPFSLDDSSALWTYMPVEFMMLLCSWLAIRLALRR